MEVKLDFFICICSPTISLFQCDSSRHLEWLKTVKDSHGSVELSSLSLASAINTNGVYVISAQNRKKVRPYRYSLNRFSLIFLEEQ